MCTVAHSGALTLLMKLLDMTELHLISWSCSTHSINGCEIPFSMRNQGLDISVQARMLSRRLPEDLNSDRNVGTHNNKGPMFPGFEVNSVETPHFFVNTLTLKKEANPPQHEEHWKAVKIRWLPLCEAEDLDHQESSSATAQCKHTHKMPLLCYSHFCLRRLPLLRAPGLTT